MRAGDWKSYADYVNRNPDLFQDLNETPIQDYWEDFAEAYEKKHGDMSNSNWEKLEIFWSNSDIERDDLNCFIINMDISEIRKALCKMPKHVWFCNHTSRGLGFIPFKEWEEKFWNNRFEVMLGPNTKQFWVYDDIRDFYIDPPAEVLDSLPEDTQKAASELLDIVKTEPDWLNDYDYWYCDEDFEI